MSDNYCDYREYRRREKWESEYDKRQRHNTIDWRLNKIRNWRKQSPYK